MKRRVVVGSMVAVFLMVFIPVTNAIEVQTVKREISASLFSYEQLKNMDAEEIATLVLSLSNDSPELSAEFRHAVEEIENTPVSSTGVTQLSSIIIDKNQGSQPRDENQTVLEKIFWKIFNYRLFRVYLSALLFVYFQSKFTLMRTMTWSIRLLRWVKVGILLGFIDPSQQPPQTPDIVFQQDLGNNSLTVTYTPADIQWSDITEIGAGSCDPLPEGDVLVGDTLTNCTGIIALLYIPTYEVVGVFEFD
jgi:hypothetical protein